MTIYAPVTGDHCEHLICAIESDTIRAFCGGTRYAAYKPGVGLYGTVYDARHLFMTSDAARAYWDKMPIPANLYWKPAV